jgi:hypothetical protein
MRFKKKSSLPIALLCAVALFTFACNRAEDAQPQSEVAQTAPAPPANELRPDPQSVDVEGVTPPSADEGDEANVEADVAAQERELAAREAELDARERRLRELPEVSRPVPPSRRTEDRRAEVAPKPSPKPSIKPSSKPSPKPSPSPAPSPEEPRRAEPRPEAESRREAEPRSEAEPRPDEPDEVAEQPDERPAEKPLVRSVTVPAGATFDVEFTKTLASNTSAPGDSFRVRVAHDVMEDGEIAIPAGSEILGEVTEAVPLRKVGGQAKLALRFTDLVLPSGKTVPIDASFVQQGRNETGKDAATIGGAAAGGAILGRILNKGSRGKGSVIGAIIGAAAGTVIASRTPGEEVVISTGSVLSVRLDDSVRVESRR